MKLQEYDEKIHELFLYMRNNIATIAYNPKIKYYNVNITFDVKTMKEFEKFIYGEYDNERINL